MKTGARLFLSGIAACLTMTVPIHAQDAATNTPPTPAPAPTPEAPPVADDRAKIQQAVHLMQAHQFDAALATLNNAIELNPQDAVAYFLRASIFASRNVWPAAEKDLLVAESIRPSDVDIEMFLGDVFLIEKKYDDARKRFAGLVKDENRGDIATFKVFVCDVLDNQNDAVTTQLAAFDHTTARPSCYYAHATVSLVAKKPDDARRWLDSAAVLYGPAVTAPYAQCLRSLGYLPPPKANP